MKRKRIYVALAIAIYGPEGAMWLTRGDARVMRYVQRQMEPFRG